MRKIATIALVAALGISTAGSSYAWKTLGKKECWSFWKSQEWKRKHGCSGY